MLSSKIYIFIIFWINEKERNDLFILLEFLYLIELSIYVKLYQKQIKLRNKVNKLNSRIHEISFLILFALIREMKSIF